MTETRVVASSLICPVCRQTVSGPFSAEFLLEVHLSFACGKPWLEDDDD